MCVCVCVVRTLKVYSFSKFQVYNTVWLNIVTILYTGSPELIHLIPESLYPLTNIKKYVLLDTYIFKSELGRLHHITISWAVESISNAGLQLWSLIPWAQTLGCAPSLWEGLIFLEDSYSVSYVYLLSGPLSPFYYFLERSDSPFARKFINARNSLQYYPSVTQLRSCYFPL